MSKNRSKNLPESSSELTKSGIRARKLQRLEEYMGLVNMVPPDIPLLDIGPIARSFDPSLREGTIQLAISKFKILLHFLDGQKIPPAFREYILEIVDEKVVRLEFDPQDTEFVYLRSGIYVALRRFDEVCEVRDNLRAIARAGSSSTPGLHAETRKPWNVTAKFDIIIDDDGILQWDGDDFAKTIQGLEADRIRECPVCKSIFWANPISKRACSPRCRNLHNVRKHRETMKKNGWR